MTELRSLRMPMIGAEEFTDAGTRELGGIVVGTEELEETAGL